MMKRRVKIASSAYRVLLLLKKLNEGDYSIDELNNFFYEDVHVKRYFSRDVILKYLNTLRDAGYDISKPSASGNHSYKLNNSRVNIDFSDEEIKILGLLRKYTKSLHQKRLFDNYISFIEKLKRFMSQARLKKLEKYFESREAESDDCFSKFDKYSGLIKKTEQYIDEKQRVEIKYKPSPKEDEKIALAELQNIKYEQEDVRIVFYNLLSGRIDSLKASQVIDIKQLPIVSKLNQLHSPVIFKVKDKLARVYRPYEKEKLAGPDDKGHITVTTYPEDMEALLKRLLRYGASCEVVYPRQVRDKMAFLVKETLENYKKNH